MHQLGGFKVEFSCNSAWRWPFLWYWMKWRARVKNTITLWQQTSHLIFNPLTVWPCDQRDFPWFDLGHCTRSVFTAMRQYVSHLDPLCGCMHRWMWHSWRITGKLHSLSTCLQIYLRPARPLSNLRRHMKGEVLWVQKGYERIQIAQKVAAYQPETWYTDSSFLARHLSMGAEYGGALQLRVAGLTFTALAARLVPLPSGHLSS